MERRMGEEGGRKAHESQGEHPESGHPEHPEPGHLEHPDAEHPDAEHQDAEQKKSKSFFARMCPSSKAETKKSPTSATSKATDPLLVKGEVKQQKSSACVV